MADWLGVDVSDRTCKQCFEPLPGPETATARRVYCSRRCKNRAGIAKRVAYNRRWRAENPEKVAAIRAAYREQAAAIMRRYYADNPEVFARLRQKRRAAVSLDCRLVTERDWRRLTARYDHRCAYCGKQGPLTRDHIVPLHRGGRHAIGNLIPACRACNGSKSALLLIEWRAKRFATAN